jgi:2-polyprenyl-3-methyl-5-hydroxy-6-metoxy-1,4-benzoquinol methylase
MNYIEEQLPASNKKRVDYLYKIIKEAAVKNDGYDVLDVGCGTGELFTIPLAQRLIKTNIKIWGIDIHRSTIERAQNHVKKLNLNNLSFNCQSIEENKNMYDCICLMAVLEHLDNPSKMIFEIKKRLKPGGMFILFIPNGYGLYELESALYKKLKRRKILPDISEESRFLIRETKNEENNIHIQFFSLKAIKKILEENSFYISDIIKIEAVGGPLSNKLLFRVDLLRKINFKIARFIPNTIASEWTFICIDK